MVGPWYINTTMPPPSLFFSSSFPPTFAFDFSPSYAKHGRAMILLGIS
jgi:hypothetical protein